jgi:hypothetical protein
MGVDIRSPSDEDLQLALREIWSFSDSEHPNSWLRFGFESGQMYMLDVYEGGTVIFSQWADPDFENEMTPERKLTNVSIQVALGLWRSLRDGNLSTIVGEDWE